MTTIIRNSANRSEGCMTIIRNSANRSEGCMTIIRNSAKCTACGTEIVSNYRHDFNVHYCKVEPTPGKKWEDGKLVPSGETTWRFAVDGGKSYLRRCGEGYEDTSILDADGIRTYEDGMPS